MVAEKFLEKAGNQSLGTYIGTRQSTVTEWVALHPILEVCYRETGYEEGGTRREPWWRQTAYRKQLGASLKDIFVAEREWCWKSVRCGRGGGDRDAEESEDGSGSDGSRDAGKETGGAQAGE